MLRRRIVNLQRSFRSVYIYSIIYTVVIKILHITDVYISGVGAAIDSFCKNTPEYEHIILSDISRKNAISSITKIKRKIKQETPDIVHLHSTFAGVYGRIVSLKTKTGCSKCPTGVKIIKPKIVYSPHCYAFERQDISGFLQKIYLLAEKILSFRTDSFALCSEYELKLTKTKVNSKKNAVFIPNISLIKKSRELTKSSILTRKNLILSDCNKLSKTIITSGRISEQKNPKLFNEIAIKSINQTTKNATHNAFEFIWIGNTTKKTNTGYAFHITKWLSQSDTLKIMKKADIYLHTASWEGFPISILDANELSLPIIAFDQNYLMKCPKQWLFKNAYEAINLINSILFDGNIAKKCVNDWNNALSQNTAKVQRDRLIELYKTLR